MGKKKYIILIILIVLSFMRLYYTDRSISFLDVIVTLGGALVFWGIFVWGYDNPEARQNKK